MCPALLCTDQHGSKSPQETLRQQHVHCPSALAQVASTEVRLSHCRAMQRHSTAASRCAPCVLKLPTLLSISTPERSVAKAVADEAVFVGIVWSWLRDICVARDDAGTSAVDWLAAGGAGGRGGTQCLTFSGEGGACVAAQKGSGITKASAAAASVRHQLPGDMAGFLTST